jgi:hypothetical protein
MKTILFNASSIFVLTLFAVQGALACFWPKQWKSLQRRFPRGYNPDSPGGRMLERYRTRESTLGERLSGAASLFFAIIGFLWFVHHLFVV